MKKSKSLITMLDIVRSVQDNARTDEEVVAVMAHMFNTRRVRFMKRSASRRAQLLPTAA